MHRCRNWHYILSVTVGVGRGEVEMAVTFSCDKCGRSVNSFDDLFHIVVRNANSGMAIAGRDSKPQDLCKRCLDWIMHEANKPDARCADAN